MHKLDSGALTQASMVSVPPYSNIPTKYEYNIIDNNK